jgi:hypothetical protein
MIPAVEFLADVAVDPGECSGDLWRAGLGQHPVDVPDLSSCLLDRARKTDSWPVARSLAHGLPQPYCRRVADRTLVDWAESGLVTLTGHATGPPLVPPPGRAATAAHELSTRIHRLTSGRVELLGIPAAPVRCSSPALLPSYPARPVEGLVVGAMAALLDCADIVIETSRARALAGFGLDARAEPAPAARLHRDKWVLDTPDGPVPVSAPRHRDPGGSAPDSGADTEVVLAELEIPAP